MPRFTRTPSLILMLALGACTQAGDGGEAVAVGGDACGAADYQGFVGQRVDALNDVDLPEGARVLFPTTPATMDFIETRLNIGVNSDDVIERAFCG